MWPTNKILMIRPASFGYNTETALTNSFQHVENDGEAQNALFEFDQMVQQLQQHGIDVMVINDTIQPKKPDAIFPNNWFSTHKDGSCILYPMLHQNRRIERRADIIQQVCKNPNKLTDLSYLENENLFLEGTGSLVIDHAFNLAYAAISPRTCLAALTVFEEIEISIQQLENFAGNMLCLKNSQNNNVLVMSFTAFDSLNVVQLNALKKHHQIIAIPIPSTEKIGGGSVRCMMAELF